MGCGATSKQPVLRAPLARFVQCGKDCYAKLMYDFQNDGLFRFYSACVECDLVKIESALAPIIQNVAGVRLAGLPLLASFLEPNGAVGKFAAQLIGLNAKPVRAVLFNKSSENNWGLAWHQDRTIVVRERIETIGFGPWTVKSGLQHVAPPTRILEAMITLRLHLDPVPDDNAPLMVIPGSHKFGRISENEIKSTVDSLPADICLADRGDIWAYSTLIVHGSKPSKAAHGRRVLQIDYSQDILPNGLNWLGIS
jgi:hypothetical protein